MYTPERYRGNPRRLREWCSTVEAIHALREVDDPGARYALEIRQNGDFKRSTLLVEIGQWPEDLQLRVAQIAYGRRETPLRELVREIRKARLELD